MMKKKILKLLDRSLDAPLGPRDRERLDRALAAWPELERTRENLLALRRDLAGARTASFRPEFAERTLARARSEGLFGAGAEPGFLPVVAGLARRAALAGLILVVAVASYVLISGELIPRDAVYYVSNLSLDRILELPLF